VEIENQPSIHSGLGERIAKLGQVDHS
jgi:hypothetical protein